MRTPIACAIGTQAASRCRRRPTDKHEVMQQIIEFLTHHWFLSSALLAVLILMALNELWTALRGEKPLPATEAVRLIDDQNALRPGHYDSPRAARMALSHVPRMSRMPKGLVT